MTTLLDDLSGYEFEDAVASLFRALDYEDVSVATRVADEGRDITMYDGETAYVVECKHTDTVSRPVVQKLHSAVATYSHDGPKHGMVVTSGRFTGPAEKYAKELRERGDPHPIELLDGTDIRELGESVGMDLRNGRIEILCEETLPVGDPEHVLAAVFEEIKNAPPRTKLPEPAVEVGYNPIVDIEAVTRSTFETGAGVIHRINRRDRLIVEADPAGPRLAPGGVSTLTGIESVALSDEQKRHGGEAVRFGLTESEARDWTRERLCDRLETTVAYTGDNNVTYEQTCRPSPDDVALQQVEPCYLPRVDAAVELGAYTHRYEYDAAGERHVPRTDGIRRCVHCETAGADAATYTYCENCGSISCGTHTKTERLESEPVCTGCAVTGEFFYATKYFFDEENRAAFRDEYEAMPIHHKAMENPYLTAAIVAAALLVVAAVAVAAL
ncbi:homolog to restriction system mrr [Natronomonas pharaonis DSM 2160]|uniref:Homolog to restriction system mrr n=1 Tax=Natronomonas pharaonis (strain ATCC 35678 / DSM 2160 / CIP 103997 / JCM 8858 / NBRC 14720 / NCIMB 2260 / Gabara) TaxID=348780 RepID=A0A1U7ETH9_NATPD|nr:restriction endonuclease [Natronomonas pharaonis]CAI48209.1 homolog to restriction system mrr [Natronomonas pharaonis DSM 2160]